MSDPNDSALMETLAASDALADTVAPVSAPSRVDVTTLSPAELEAGERYSAGIELGAGGMGAVRLDRDRRIGREVAVKRLHERLGTSEDSQLRFLREARVQGQLEHPAIVPVYDLGKGEDGALYFTMKRVRGRTLAEVIAEHARGERRFGRRRLLSAFSQVCLAIDYAHARGVVHRDLKPANVMLGDWGEVYVLDWGLAKVAGASEALPSGELVEAEGALPATQQGSIFGTPGYMSPEQARGAHDRVDAKSDVFALGAILYEILACRPMIARGTPVRMLAATMTGDFEPPSAHASDVPPELEALWAEATALDPEARMGSARALSEGIERFLDGDRDREMRRTRALEHAARASREAERAFAMDDLEARQLAAREAGSALALDPEQKLARETLSALFTKPPERMPEEARAHYDAEERDRQRDAYAGLITAIVLYLPALLALSPLLDLRSWWPMGIAAVVMALGAGFALYARKTDPASAWGILGVNLVVSLGFLLMATIVSPLLVVPVFAALNTMIASLFPGRAPRWGIALVGALPLLYALADLAGIAPSSLALDSGALRIAPAILGRFQPWMLWAMVVLSYVPPAISITIVGRMVEQANAARRALHVSRWQLAQILPDEGRAP